MEKSLSRIIYNFIESMEIFIKMEKSRKIIIVNFLIIELNVNNSNWCLSSLFYSFIYLLLAEYNH